MDFADQIIFPYGVWIIGRKINVDINRPSWDMIKLYRDYYGIVMVCNGDNMSDWIDKGSYLRVVGDEWMAELERHHNARRI